MSSCGVEVVLSFVGGPKDGATLTMIWEMENSALCHRYNRGMWWWGALVVVGDQDYLYTSHPEEHRTTGLPPRQLCLEYQPQATLDQHDIFRVW